MEKGATILKYYNTGATNQLWSFEFVEEEETRTEKSDEEIQVLKSSKLKSMESNYQTTLIVDISHKSDISDIYFDISDILCLRY